MHEQSYSPEGDRNPLTAPLRRFSNDLRLIVKDAEEYGNDLTDSHPSVKDIFIKYIEDELDMSEYAARRMLDYLQQDDTLPKDDVLIHDPISAVEAYRMSILNVVMPLYQFSHSENEFRVWLTSAIHVAVPKDSRHNVEVCLRTDDTADTNCEIGVCPIRSLATQTTESLVSPDFIAMDYLLDPQKTYRNTHALLGLVVWRKFIPDSEKRQLESCYNRQYSSYGFPLV